MTDNITPITHKSAAGSRQWSRNLRVPRITREALVEADRHWRMSMRRILNASDEALGFAMAELARDAAFSLWCTLYDAENQTASEPPPSA